MANNTASNIVDTFQNIFLAGVGALSIGGDKAKEVIDELIERGQVTVDQGRKLNEELKHKASESTSKLREESIRAYVDTLSPEERANFAAQMGQLAREIGEDADSANIAQAAAQDASNVVIGADGVYVGDDINPVDHLKSEA